MKIKIIMKSATKTRGVEPVEYNVNDNIKTLKDLIENLVDIEIDKYLENKIKALSQKEIDEMVENGKITFGFRYREEFNKSVGIKNNIINRVEAKEVAYLAFNDGLYVVFIGRNKIEDLNQAINIGEEDEVSFIRLTMLAGRYF